LFENIKTVCGVFVRSDKIFVDTDMFVFISKNNQLKKEWFYEIG